MSVRQISEVWRWADDVKGSLRLVLLALADCAKHDGTRAFPGNDRLAAMTGLHARYIQVLLRRLVARHKIRVERVGGGRRRHTVYRLLITPQLSLLDGPENHDPGSAVMAARNHDRRIVESVAPGTAVSARNHDPGIRNHDPGITPSIDLSPIESGGSLAFFAPIRPGSVLSTERTPELTLRPALSEESPAHAEPADFVAPAVSAGEGTSPSEPERGGLEGSDQTARDAPWVCVSAERGRLSRDVGDRSVDEAAAAARAHLEQLKARLQEDPHASLRVRRRRAGTHS